MKNVHSHPLAQALVTEDDPSLYRDRVLAQLLTPLTQALHLGPRSALSMTAGAVLTIRRSEHKPTKSSFTLCCVTENTA